MYGTKFQQACFWIALAMLGIFGLTVTLPKRIWQNVKGE